MKIPGRKKERKQKKKMEEQAKRVPLPDLLDDNDREQIQPADEPTPEQQDERWAFQAGDPRQPQPTPGPQDEENK